MWEKKGFILGEKTSKNYSVRFCFVSYVTHYVILFYYYSFFPSTKRIKKNKIKTKKRIETNSKQWVDDFTKLVLETECGGKLNN